MGRIVEFASNGGTARGYLTSPPSEGAGPGLVVIQEWWGLVPHIEDVCDRFAAEGFTALAPDLYRGESASEPDEAGKLMMALNLEQAARDLGGAVDFLGASDDVRGHGVGVVGFCMGGGLALMLAAQRPGEVRACVPFYGVIPWQSAQPDWRRVTAAVQLHVAEKDGFFTPAAAAELEQTLKDVGVEVEQFVYTGADHAFFNDTRPEVFDDDAARQAFVRTLEFLRAKLG